MIEITKCPSLLIEGFDRYCPKARKMLFSGVSVNPILEFDIDEFRSEGVIVEAMHRISVSGVQEKFSALIDAGEIKIAEKDKRSTHILKPAPWDKTLRDRKFIPANEHLTMQIASQVYGIHTAANGLCFTSKGQPVYITRRFDVLSDGMKLKLEDFASIIGRNEVLSGLHFKYQGCYEDIAKAIRTYVAAWQIDMERFFELVIFNYIYANEDAHLKNFSLIQMDNEYRLAPAYDLMNVELHFHGDDFGLDGGLSHDIEKSDALERTGHPCHVDFERFGYKIGLMKSRVEKILAKYSCFPGEALRLVDRSFLSDKLKRSYIRIVNERINRFNRH